MNIEKLKELLGAATPGPWGEEDSSLVNRDLGNEYDPPTDMMDQVPSWDIGQVYAPQNRALIVAAVNALPSLIARVEAAERLVAELRKAAKAHEIKADRNGLDDASRSWHMGASEVAGDCADLLAAALTTYDQEKARG